MIEKKWKQAMGGGQCWAATPASWPLWLEPWVQGLSQDPAGSAACLWPWWKEVDRTPRDALWVTEWGGQPKTGSRGNLRLACQSGSMSRLVSGVKLKVRPSQIHFHAKMALGVLHCCEKDHGAPLAEDEAAHVPLLRHCCLPAFCVHLGLMRNRAPAVQLPFPEH